MRLVPISPKALVRGLKPVRRIGAPATTTNAPWRRGRFRLRPAPIKSYGRIGSLEVRLAQSRGDIRRAQRLRFEVFYEEMSAVPTAATLARRRDEDQFDPVCDHLLVVDHNQGSADKKRPWRMRPKVVGTYRILRQEAADKMGGFYTQGEYDIAPIIAAHPDVSFMELGRSCVLRPYRNKRSVELLWHGLWTYIREHRIGALIGCASFEGTDPQEHAQALSFLHHHALAPEEWRAKAHPDIAVPMDLLPSTDIDQRAALRALPPLIKGYLRLGAYVGEGAVVDRQFGTTDVLIVLPVSAIDPRYFAHFGAPDEVKARIAGAAS